MRKMHVVFKLMFTAIVCGAMFVGCGSCGNKDKEACCESETACTEQTAGDKLLADYEAFVEEYFAVAQKVGEGNVEAALKMKDFGTKMQEWSAKLAEAYENGTLTEEKHKAKMDELAEKLTTLAGVKE